MSAAHRSMAGELPPVGHSLAFALEAILPAPRSHERIEARFLRPDRTMLVRWYRAVPPLLADLSLQRDTTHCFFGVALRSGGGTAAHCTRVAALWADIDAKLWQGEADPLGAAHAALLAAPLPPSIAVCTGGGWHPYWLLTTPIEVRQERARLERLGRGLARAVCGPGRRPDHVQDVARVLRLPGSLNHKYAPARPVTVTSCEPSRRYSLEQIEQTLGQAACWTQDEDAAPATVPVWHGGTDAPPQALSARAFLVRPSAQRLLDSTGACGYLSPSEADAAAAAALVGGGLTADEAYTLLLASSRGRDALARKGARHQAAYWRRTVEHAARYVGPVIIRQGIRARIGTRAAHPGGRDR